MSVLALDQYGRPHRWISARSAVCYHFKGLVAFQLGEEDIIFRGISQDIATAGILAIRGETGLRRHVPELTNRVLFSRDRYTCAYCGHVFPDEKLTRDHVYPVSKGGKDCWENVVTSCGTCNKRKDARLLSETNMRLRFTPYTPTHAEYLILRKRNMSIEQANYLARFVPRNSRINMPKMETV